MAKKGVVMAEAGHTGPQTATARRSPAAAWRALLFLPADDHGKAPKAAASNAQAIIVDLEDGVAATAKAGARASLDSIVSVVRSGGKDVVLRINSSWTAAIEDLSAAPLLEIVAIMVPKVENPARLEVLAEILSEFESAKGLKTGSVGLLPLIESAMGVLNSKAIAQAPRVCGIAFGTEDFSLDLGVSPTAEALDLPCRQIALSASAARVPAFAIPVSIASFRDSVGMFSAARRAKSYGVSGALCIHPAQADIANRAFAPTDDELAQAKSVVEAWNQAVADGQAIIRVDGKMVDAPVAARAMLLLSRALDQATA